MVPVRTQGSNGRMPAVFDRNSDHSLRRDVVRPCGERDRVRSSAAGSGERAQIELDKAPRRDFVFARYGSFVRLQAFLVPASLLPE